MKTTECKFCKADFVFLQNQKSHWIPTDIDSLSESDVELVHRAEKREGQRPLFDPERGHINHLHSCPESPKRREMRKRASGVS